MAVYCHTDEEFAHALTIPAFIPVWQYGGTEDALPEEIGRVGEVRYIAAADPVIAERRKQIRDTWRGHKHATPNLQAECSVMGHIRLGTRSVCFYCGAHWE